MPFRFALLTASALVAAPLLPALAQTAGQTPPVGTDLPSNQQEPGVVRPKPDVHGRSDGGEMQTHGNDAASPSVETTPAAPPCKPEQTAQNQQGDAECTPPAAPGGPTAPQL
jgi:hypothetical protein